MPLGHPAVGEPLQPEKGEAEALPPPVAVGQQGAARRQQAGPEVPDGHVVGGAVRQGPGEPAQRHPVSRRGREDLSCRCVAHEEALLQEIAGPPPGRPQADLEIGRQQALDAESGFVGDLRPEVGIDGVGIDARPQGIDPLARQEMERLARTEREIAVAVFKDPAEQSRRVGIDVPGGAGTQPRGEASQGDPGLRHAVAIQGPVELQPGQQRPGVAAAGESQILAVRVHPHDRGPLPAGHLVLGPQPQRAGAGLGLARAPELRQGEAVAEIENAAGRHHGTRRDRGAALVQAAPARPEVDLMRDRARAREHAGGEQGLLRPLLLPQAEPASAGHAVRPDPRPRAGTAGAPGAVAETPVRTAQVRADIEVRSDDAGSLGRPDVLVAVLLPGGLRRASGLRADAAAVGAAPATGQGGGGVEPQLRIELETAAAASPHLALAAEDGAVDLMKPRLTPGPESVFGQRAAGPGVGGARQVDALAPAGPWPAAAPQSGDQSPPLVGAAAREQPGRRLRRPGTGAELQRLHRDLREGVEIEIAGQQAGHGHVGGEHLADARKALPHRRTDLHDRRRRAAARSATAHGDAVRQHTRRVLEDGPGMSRGGLHVRGCEPDAREPPREKDGAADPVRIRIERSLFGPDRTAEQDRKGQTETDRRDAVSHRCLLCRWEAVEQAKCHPVGERKPLMDRELSVIHGLLGVQRIGLRSSTD